MCFDACRFSIEVTFQRLQASYYRGVIWHMAGKKDEECRPSGPLADTTTVDTADRSWHKLLYRAAATTRYGGTIGVLN